MFTVRKRTGLDLSFEASCRKDKAWASLGSSPLATARSSVTQDSASFIGRMKFWTAWWGFLPAKGDQKCKPQDLGAVGVFELLLVPLADELLPTNAKVLLGLAIKEFPPLLAAQDFSVVGFGLHCPNPYSFEHELCCQLYQLYIFDMCQKCN